MDQNILPVQKKKISIVCPVYNEEEAIPLFYNRLKAVIQEMHQKYDFEVIFTNNASSDTSLDIIKNIRHTDPSVQVISLSRNFGYQASLLAGLHYAKGDAIVMIDVDCEDPPELIPQFISKWEEGYDIVYGKRGKRSEFIGLQLMRKAFYRITRFIADYDFVLDMAEFSLISANVRDAVLQNQTSFPFIRSELGFVGFKRFGISYKREPRIHGKSHYNFVKMIQFAVGGILSSSTFLLRLATYIGLPLALINVLFVFIGIFSWIKIDVQKIFLIDFVYVILILAFLSTYMARIYKDGIRRSVYIVDWKNSILDRDSADKYISDKRE